MKILQEGRDQKGWAKELVCNVDGGCGATLLVEQGDLFFRPGTDDDEQYVAFHCGACGMKNKLDSKTTNTVPNWDMLPKEARGQR